MWRLTQGLEGRVEYQPFVIDIYGPLIEDLKHRRRSVEEGFCDCLHFSASKHLIPTYM